MNFKERSETLGLEEDEYVELFQLFVETSMTDLEKLQCAIDNANSDSIAGIAHSLKGAAVNLGLEEFYRIAKEIEKTAQDGRLEEITKLILMLQEKLVRVADGVTY